MPLLRPILLTVVGLSLAGMVQGQTPDLERSVREDLSPDQWQALLAKLKDQPALAAHAYRLRCLHLLDRFDAPAKAAVTDAIQQGLPLAARTGATADEAGLRLCQGTQEEAAGRLNEAFTAYDQAARLATQAHDDDLLGQALIVRGSLRYSRGEAHTALLDLQEAYRLATQRQDVDQISNALNSLANLYASRQLAQYDKALEYYQESLKLNENRNKPLDVATTQFNIGSTLNKLHRPAEAHVMLQKALAGYQALKDEGSVGETQREIAQLLNGEGKPAAALPRADAAVTAAQQQADKGSLALAQLVRAKSLRLLGRLNEAARDLDAARGHFEAQRNPRALERLLDEQAELYAAQQRWEAAYRARTQQRDTQEQLTRQQNEELSAGLRIGFDTERKEQENAALQKAAEAATQIRHLQSALILLGAVLLGGVGVLAWRMTRQARQMRHLALSDELTGLPNRRAILSSLAQRLAAGETVPLLIFDIDHFKRINDRLGHDVGDRVLREVARHTRAALGGDGELGRIGGEEFLVLLKTAQIEAVAERLRAAVQALRFEDLDPPLTVTISLGGTRAQPGESSPEVLLKRADLALYEAKEAGRNQGMFKF